MKENVSSVYLKRVPDVGRTLGVLMVTERYRLVKWYALDSSVVENEFYDREVDFQENFSLINELHYKSLGKSLKLN